MLKKIDDFDQFKRVRDVSPNAITPEILQTVRQLDERTELESAILSALADPNSTPHGPAEIYDIFTHRVTIANKVGLAAFILKGRSFQTVRQDDVSHQIFKLRKVEGLEFAVFAAVGNVLDAVKDEFVTTASDLDLDYAIFDTNDIGRLLVAYGFVCPRDGRKLENGRCRCGYRPQTEALNLFQKEAIQRLKDSHADRKHAGLIVLPTGSGKTRVAVLDAVASGADRVLYVAHTHEILESAQSEFEAIIGNQQVIHVRSKADLVGNHRVKLATVQLCRNNTDYLKQSHFDYMVVDEFHHASAPSYRTTVEAAAPDFLLGLTATPFRNDHEDIRELCDNNLIVEFQLLAGINSGILAPYHYYGCFDDIDYGRILPKNGNYAANDLDRLVEIPERDIAIVYKWRELADGLPTLAFCYTQSHAERMAAVFTAAGVPAVAYISTTPWEQRDVFRQRLLEGEIKVICTVDILNEGVDLPFVECLLFLRLTYSQRVFLQQLGRGLRRYPGKFAVKVIDFIGNFRNAYKILDFHTLNAHDATVTPFDKHTFSVKDILTLPLGCSVQFDSRVFDIFELQLREPGRITRSNIAQILIYYYKQLCKSRGHICSADEVDRFQILTSDLYKQVFGRWKDFEVLMRTEPDLADLHPLG